MTSLGARLVRPMVSVMGRQLQASKSAEGTRVVAARWGKTLPPAVGVSTEQASLGGIPAIHVDGRRGHGGARVLLVLHGGGYVFGSARIYRGLTARLARLCQAHAWVIDYRLAPEHPYPAAVEDALAAYRALLERHAPTDVAFVGDSAGGGLAVATMHRARDSGLPVPGCAVLLSPWLDLTGSGASMHANAASEILIPHPLSARMAELYAAGIDKADPGVSPLFGRHENLPPLLLQASASEILYSDSQRFVERARDAGVDVTFQVEADMWHVWQLMAPVVAEARMALEAAAGFIEVHTHA